MNILYIGSFRLPNYDAAASRVLNMARALRLAGHKVSFISWGGMQIESTRCEDGQFRVDGFPYIVTNELPQPGISTLARLRNKINRGKITKSLLSGWADPVDVIITYNNCLSNWLLLFCKKRGIKLINDITEWYTYNELRPTDWLGYTYNMRFTQLKVKNKILISSYLDRFYDRTHNIVVPATCDASETKWHNTPRINGLTERVFDGITLIYAGNPARKDAIHYAINAVNRLANEGAKIRFIIVGITKEYYVERYNRKTVKEPNEAIMFFGRVPQDEVPCFYRIADFMVLLRENNRKSNAGFPTKFAESFISGTPVIANLTSDLGNYLKDGETGYVVNEPNEDAIYRVLKEKVLLLNQKEIATLRRNVQVEAKRLDYHAYIEPLRLFMTNLG